MSYPFSLRTPKGRRMRSRFWFPLSLSLATVAPAALAQEDDPPETDAEELPTEGEGMDVLPPARPSAPKAGGRDTAPGEVHTVSRGDTLWDLSQRYLGNSWYWPKVWSYNPEIANPHWIYPGNRVRFFPDAEEAPTQVETGEGPKGITELEGVEPGEAFTDAEGGTIEVMGKIGANLPTASYVQRDSFVTPREIEEAGLIESSFAENMMLSFQDQVYVTFKQAGGRIGDRYLIFRTGTEIRNPRTGARAGFMTRLLGTARVLRVNDRVSTMRIEEAWDDIRRGDLIGPYGERIGVRVAPKPTRNRLEGIVLTSAYPGQAIMGEYHSLIVDKGSQDGVEVGHEFVIVRKGNYGGRLTNPTKFDGRSDLPWEDIAVCMATDVKETASTCLLKRSLRDVVPGDRWETRPGEASTPVSRR